MPQGKKKLSKNAKTAAKLLKDSKLLADSKLLNDKKLPQNIKLANFPANTNAPNKMRPEKKRGQRNNFFKLSKLFVYQTSFQNKIERDFKKN